MRAERRAAPESSQGTETREFEGWRELGGRNVVCPTVVWPGLLNPACTLESPGALLKSRCPGRTHTDVIRAPGWDPACAWLGLSQWLQCSQGSGLPSGFLQKRGGVRRCLAESPERLVRKSLSWKFRLWAHCEEQEECRLRCPVAQRRAMPSLSAVHIKLGKLVNPWLTTSGFSALRTKPGVLATGFIWLGPPSESTSKICHVQGTRTLPWILGVHRVDPSHPGADTGGREL